MHILLDSNVWLAILTTDGQCRRMWRASASAARCEYLVTGDNDLLVLKQFNDVAIVTPAEFAKRDS